MKIGVSCMQSGAAGLAVLSLCQGHSAGLVVLASVFVALRTARLVLP